jgi:DNA-binding FadR family transcriptional regulator
MPDSPAFLKPIRVTRAYEELAAAIRLRILSGELRDGDRLPSEAALAKEAQVSRPTVREALRTLEEAGFLHRVSPKIMVVRSRPADQTFEVLSRAYERRNVTFRHVHEAQEALVPRMMTLAAERATEEDLDTLRANIQAQEATIEDIDEWNRLARKFQLEVAHAAGNPALFIARVSLSELLAPAVRLLFKTPERTRRAFDSHKQTVEEIAARDGEGAAYISRKAIIDFRWLWEQDGLSPDMAVAELPTLDAVQAADTGWVGDKQGVDS